MTVSTFRVLKGNTIHGPYSQEQLTKLANKGKLQLSDMVSIDGAPWIPLSQIWQQLSNTGFTQTHGNMLAPPGQFPPQPRPAYGHQNQPSGYGTPGPFDHVAQPGSYSPTGHASGNPHYGNHGQHGPTGQPGGFEPYTGHAQAGHARGHGSHGQNSGYSPSGAGPQYHPSSGQGPFDAYGPNGPPNSPHPLGTTKKKDRIVAGLLAIFLGTLGVHKFYLGFTGPGLVVLLLNTIGFPLNCLTFGAPIAVTSLIALIEGIIYLTKSEAEFHQLYVIERKQWF